MELSIPQIRILDRISSFFGELLSEPVILEEASTKELTAIELSSPFLKKATILEVLSKSGIPDIRVHDQHITINVEPSDPTVTIIFKDLLTHKTDSREYLPTFQIPSKNTAVSIKDIKVGIICTVACRKVVIYEVFPS